MVQDALAINPNLKIVASPWSAPGWMKSNGSMICNTGGGDSSLLPADNQAWADYFVSWIQAYQAHGIPIWAVTPQNEPGYCPTNYPGMTWTRGGRDELGRELSEPRLNEGGPDQEDPRLRPQLGVLPQTRSPANGGADNSTGPRATATTTRATRRR